MVVYLPTLTLHVGKYASPMDPMGYEVEAVFVSPRNAVLHCSVEAPGHAVSPW